MPTSDYTKNLLAAELETTLADTAVIHMHTGDPGTAGTANVLTPGDGYAHLTGVAMSVTGAVMSNVDQETLGTRTGGGNVTLTHFSIWNAAETQLIAYAALTSSVAYNVSVAPPYFPAGNLTVTVSDAA